MAKHSYHVYVVILSVLIFHHVQAGIRSVDLSSGYAYNIPSALLVMQDGRDNIILTAQYETESMRNIPYFLVRLNYQIGKGILEAQYMHHKINMKNTTGEIQHFEIADGLNILSINYRLTTRHLSYRFGFGAALTYCKSTVRGYEYIPSEGLFNSGYFFAGPVLLFGINREFDVSSSFFLNLETQFTASWLLVPVAGGYAHVSNFALHLLFGFGYKF